ncbi:MAG: DUF2520 domain-containing protein [Bacteroidia bacterium]|nr:DUF2520 domain-containing protein [Bacteroidia bacterium]
MLSVVLIGAGNVSAKLQQAFSRSEEIKLLAVYGREERKGEILPSGQIVSSISEFEHETDIIVIAVQDDAISIVQKEIGATNALVVHTAGSIPMNVLLPIERRGVFYPLQTLSADREVDFSSIPICLECAMVEDNELLEELAGSISGSVNWINSGERQRLHLAAVFTNNFVNHMIRQAEKICEQHDVPKEMLHPLLDETIAKAKELGAFKAQTGPAIRGDMSVIDKHIKLLPETVQQELYKTISASIQYEYESQL